MVDLSAKGNGYSAKLAIAFGGGRLCGDCEWHRDELAAARLTRGLHEQLILARPDAGGDRDALIAGSARGAAQSVRRQVQAASALAPPGPQVRQPLSARL